MQRVGMSEDREVLWKVPGSLQNPAEGLDEEKMVSHTWMDGVAHLLGLAGDHTAHLGSCRS